MPKIERIKTKYPGIYYIMGEAPNGKKEKIYYARYRYKGEEYDEKVGRQHRDGMTPARAAGERADRISGKSLSNKARREAAEAEKRAKQDKWTVDRLAEEYFENRSNNKSKTVDKNRYKKHLKDSFGSKEPHKILPLDIQRLKKKLSKKKSDQTIKHILNLLTWITNHGVKHNYCQGVPFHIKKPTVNNEKTEDLKPDQLKALLEAIEKDNHPQAGPMMKLALYTGMRRGEMFKLRRKDINFDSGFILLKDPKGGPDQKIPLNAAARDLLKSHPKINKSPYVFPDDDGKMRTQIDREVRAIRDAAGLPETFRPLHGLRHFYASMLASSGQVDMYVLQKLLTHKDQRMTQRYAHLRDETLKKASDLAGDLINGAIVEDEEAAESKNN